MTNEIRILASLSSGGDQVHILYSYDNFLGPASSYGRGYGTRVLLRTLSPLLVLSPVLT